MKLLGIETSCDETAAAVIQIDEVTQSIKILSNIVSSSMQLHSKTGGIIPEIAAREQIKYMLPVINEALAKASMDKKNPSIDAIAVTVGPGLIGSLLVGVETAKTLGLVWNKPVIPVNHLFGHIYANWIEHNSIILPALAVIISGGHTDLIIINKHQDITWIGGTRDDAAGEAFDKIGRLLHLPYPAGPVIEILAKVGNPKTYTFPRPLLHDKTCDFSFSGLKTAVLREVQKLEKEEPNLSQTVIQDLARATQDAIIDVVVKKTINAAKSLNVFSIILSGGVAANQTLRDTFFHKIAQEQLSMSLYVPSKKFCTDNGAMIAVAGFFNRQIVPWENITAMPELYFD